MDVLIVSDEHGILGADDKVPYWNPHRSRFQKGISRERLKDFNEKNLERLTTHFSENRYREIFVACGKQYRMLIHGFDKLTDAKIVYCEGKGLGPMARNLGEWISNYSNATKE